MYIIILNKLIKLFINSNYCSSKSKITLLFLVYEFTAEVVFVTLNNCIGVEVCVFTRTTLLRCGVVVALKRSGS